MTLRLLLFSAVLKVAAPRPRAARYTAATTLGKLVTAASTRPPTTSSGTAYRVPSSAAARSMVTLAAITTSSDAPPTAASGHRPRWGRIAGSSSSSSSATAEASQLIHRRGSPKRTRTRQQCARTSTYNATTTAASPSPAAADRTLDTTPTHTPAVPMATIPPRITTLRCRLICPATTAPRPSSAARLNTFDPMTTPAPTRCWWLATAATTAVTSGASAASAATRPSNASDRPRRSPTRSSRETSSQLVARLTTAPPRKAATAAISASLADSRNAAGHPAAPRPAQRWHRARYGTLHATAWALGCGDGSSARAPGGLPGAVRPADLVRQSRGDQASLQRRPSARPRRQDVAPVILAVAAHPQLDLRGQARGGRAHRLSPAMIVPSASRRGG